MTPEERAKALMSQFYDELEHVDANHANDMERRIAAAIRKAEDEKLEEAAVRIESIGEAQADGWMVNPKSSECGGAIAASNTAFLAAQSIRSLKSTAPEEG